MTMRPLPQDLARRVLLCLSLVLAFGGCSCDCSTGEPPGTPDAGPFFEPDPCGRIRVLCDGLCIDPSTDSAYCGAYGNCTGPFRGRLCDPGQLCVEGACRPPCEDFEVRCDGACIDPQRDLQHCGAQPDCEAEPGENCAAGAACLEGRCVGLERCDDDAGCPRCPVGFIACDGACIDPLRSRDYCGATGACADAARGQRCADDDQCLDGACVHRCPDGFVDCGGRCIDPLTDPDFCGATGACGGDDAGRVCLDGQACDDGTCLWPCPVGLLSCGGQCVDPLTDPDFCGATGQCIGEHGGQACAGDEACIDGGCVRRCVAGELLCGDGCIDPLSDPYHCGAAGKCTGDDAGQPCSPAQVCDLGACVAGCQPPRAACGGGCVDLSSDRNHCGDCSAACEPGERCQGGSCVLGCPQGQVSCDGRCIDPAVDANYCGASTPCTGPARGQQCALGEACVGGACEPACPTGFLRCEGACYEVDSDPAHCGGCNVACGATEACNGGGCQCASPPECECVVYIDQRTGDDGNSGDSWSFPLATVTAGIEAGRRDGCAIWVAAGRYRPTEGGARNASFALQRGVFLYGGFAGGETAFAQRDVAANPTVLSGDLGVQGVVGDNSLHVLSCLSQAGCDSTAVVDGFTVRDGNANGGQDGGEGGGMRIDGAGPTIANCRFEHNLAFRGGALSSRAGTPTIVDSAFIDNAAERGGALHVAAGRVELRGAVFSGHVASEHGGSIYGEDNAQLLLIDTEIAMGEAGGDGGAVFNLDGVTELRDCDLHDNSAASRGGAVSAGGVGDYLRTRFADNRAQGLAAALHAQGESSIVDCTFERNIGEDYAGAIYVPPNSTFSMVGSALTGNRSVGYGGGLYATLSEVQLADNLFEHNESNISGGGAQITRSHLIAARNRFIDNRTVYNGGGLHSADPASEALVTDSYFHGNFADRGGGLKLSQGWAHVHRCLFEENTADHGAGLATFQLLATIHDNVFDGNVAVTYGGGMSGYYNSDLDVTNNTFHGNVITGPDEVGGAGLHSFVSTVMRVRNCILWDNRAPIGTLSEQQVFTPEMRAEVTYSNVEGGCEAPACTTDATGNLSVAPGYVDANAGDFRLRADSMCIDRGLDAAVDWPELLDRAGSPRIVDGPDPDGAARVDLGAYEWQP